MMNPTRYTASLNELNNCDYISIGFFGVVCWALMVCSISAGSQYPLSTIRYIFNQRKQKRISINHIPSRSTHPNGDKLTMQPCRQYRRPCHRLPTLLSNSYSFSFFFLQFKPRVIMSLISMIAFEN